MSGTRLSDDERGEIVEYKAQGKSIRWIAARMKRSHSTVEQALAALRSTTTLARAHYEAESLKLARVATETMIERRHVGHILDVHDRLDILPAKHAGSGGVGGGLIVCVGMPGSPALIPPTQAQLESVRPKVIDVTPEKR